MPTDEADSLIKEIVGLTLEIKEVEALLFLNLHKAALNRPISAHVYRKPPDAAILDYKNQYKNLIKKRLFLVEKLANILV